LWQFGIFCGQFGIFLPFWYVVPRKIWQPCPPALMESCFNFNTWLSFTSLGTVLGWMVELIHVNEHTYLVQGFGGKKMLHMYVHGSRTVDVRNILNMLAHDGTLGS
jgi:hypothetical protein